MNRGLFMLLCALLLGLTSVPAWAICRPENRVGKIFSEPSKTAAADLDQTLEPRGESGGCGYDFASGVHKYLYAQGNPVMGIDPSGHDLISLSIASSISASLEGMYNGGDLFAELALQHTIIGVQNHETANAILGGYFKDVAIGLGIGVAIGAVADIAGDLVYGGTVEGEPITIEVNGANTVEGSRGLAAVESTTEDVTSAAARAAQTVKAKYGLDEGEGSFGTYCHTALRNDVRSGGVGSDLNAEIIYKDGKALTPEEASGSSGYVRLDVVKGSLDRPEAIYDLKTGTARPMSEARIKQIRDNLPPESRNIPIVEIRLGGRSPKVY